jgi:hypothetical protein
MRTIPSRGIFVFLAIACGLAWAPFLPLLFGGTPVAVVFMPFAPAVVLADVLRQRVRSQPGHQHGNAAPRPSPVDTRTPVMHQCVQHREPEILEQPRGARIAARLRLDMSPRRRMWSVQSSFIPIRQRR